jgi:UDP-N-acetylglucosamine acyltransferase
MAIHPTALVDRSASVADDAEIGPYCTVGAGAQIGSGARLISHVTIEGRTTLGAGSLVYPFAALGGAPQHLGDKGEDTSLVIGERCVIRENVTLNRGTKQGRGATEVGAECYLMAGAHVAHDCVVGRNVVFANNATIGGHVKVGDAVFLGGLCAVHQNSRIGDFAFVGGCAAVTADIIPYAIAQGNHAGLAGLNIIGMKRRGVPRDTIRMLRSLYLMLFEAGGIFEERLEAARAQFAGAPEAQRIIDFIDAGAKRALMQSRRRGWTAGED